MSKLLGFTLIELMITIAVVGILASLALPGYSAYIGRIQVARVMAEMAGVRSAVEYHLGRGDQINTAEALGWSVSDYVSVHSVDVNISTPGEALLTATLGGAVNTGVQGAQVRWSLTVSGWQCNLNVSSAPNFRSVHAPSGCSPS